MISLKPVVSRAILYFALPGVLVCSTGCNALTGYVNNRAGVYRYQWCNYECARDEFLRAIANNPRNPDYYHNLAAVACRAGDTTLGESYYRQAISIDPSHQPSYHNLASLLMETGRGPEAGRLVQAWADTQPYSDSANIELAWYRQSQGDTAGAEQALVQALQANPKSHIASAKLGELYQDQGRAPEALALFERSLNQRWDQPQVQSRIASIQSANPGTIPNNAVVDTLVRGTQTSVAKMPVDGRSPVTVTAYALPRFNPGLWSDQFNSGSSHSVGSTNVQPLMASSKSTISASPTVLKSQTVLQSVIPADSDPAHVQQVGLDFKTSTSPR